MTFQASIVRLPPGLHDHLGFRDQALHGGYTARCHQIKARFGFGSRFGIGVGLMAVNATDFVGSVRTGDPVTNSCILYVTAQANAVRVCSGPLTEGDDLRNVSTTLHVQAAGAVALFTFNTLLRMEGVPEVRGDIGMAGRARICPNRRSAGNLNILRERGNSVRRLLSCYGCKGKNDNQNDNCGPRDSGMMPHRLVLATGFIRETKCSAGLG